MPRKKTVIPQNKLDLMAEAAAEAGCPRDQTATFFSAGYVPIEGMLPFHAWARDADRQGGPEWIALGGKRGPGKTHTVLAQVMEDCIRQPGLKVLFLRKIQKAAKESLSDVIRRVFLYTPHTPTQDGVELPNGSRVIVGGYKDARDIDKYLGIEYDVIVLEECTQITEEKKEKLRGSLRSSKPGWRPRIYLTTNADGVGLLWFKKEFIEPARKKQEGITRFLDVSNIVNPFINAEYDEWLGRLKGALAKAWRIGDWDAFAGMAFPMWNENSHVVQPFEIPLNWVRWRAVDEGSAAPFCCLWMARDPNTRRQYVYREAYQAELTLTQQAQLINDMSLPGEKFTFTFADPAMWQRKNRRNETYSAFDEYKDNGVYLTRADNDRISGKRKVDSILSMAADGEPGVQIFDTVTYLPEQLSTLSRDKLNPEDVDTTAEDHAYDAYRYGQTNTAKIEDTVTVQRPSPHPLAGVKGL